MIRTLLPFVLIAFLPAPASAQAITDATALSDAELATMRGALLLPSGLEVAVTVRLDTSVNGQLLLRTMYRVDEGAPEIKVYAPAPGESAPTTQTPQGMGSAAGGGSAGPGVSLVLDREGGITMIRPVLGGAPAQVSVGTGSSAALDEEFDALPALPVVPGGAGVETAGGAVSIRDLPAGTRVVLQGDQLDVSHLVGQAIGSVVANSGNDRVIDTATVVNLDLQNATPDLVGSAMFGVDALAVDAARQLAD